MRFISPLLAGTAVVLLVAACGSNSPRPSGESSATTTSSANVANPAGGVVSGEVIRVQQATPYASEGINDPAVQRECQIATQLPEFILEHAANRGVNVEIVPRVQAEDPGRNLVVRFMKTQSSGNAFTGHYKYTEIEAKLYEDGKEVADLTAGRRTGGGAFAGFKGSCSVMGRTVRTLGDDVSIWLSSPTPGMRLGNL